jgi:transposase
MRTSENPLKRKFAELRLRDRPKRVCWVVIGYSSTRMRKSCPTDLSDAEWECIEPHLPTPRAPGRPRRHSLREILDAIFYIVRSGCAWRLLPHEFPPWKTIHHWIDHNRRMSEDYERLSETSGAFIYVAMSRLMVKRSARS